MPDPITILRSPALVLPDTDIDTDQIIPARYLTTTTRGGLGSGCFADRRRNADGSPNPQSPLNDPRARGATVLVAGHNFGCGSSREHAAWALAELGIRCVISTKIADIFASNATKNGILPITVTDEQHARVAARPFAEISVDLEAQTVTPPPPDDGRPFPFLIDAFARRCLLTGTDPLGYLLDNLPAIEQFEAART